MPCGVAAIVCDRELFFPTGNEKMKKPTAGRLGVLSDSLRRCQTIQTAALLPPGVTRLSRSTFSRSAFLSVNRHPKRVPQFAAPWQAKCPYFLRGRSPASCHTSDRIEVRRWSVVQSPDSGTSQYERQRLKFLSTCRMLVACGS
jgi:hypothetical protein